MVTYPRTIWVVRHAEREDNINRKWRSLPGAEGLSRDNSMLSERGRKQAKECAKEFRKFTIDHVFSSPFDRTMETASIIIEDKCMLIKPEPGLCEALYLCEKPPGFWDTEKLYNKFKFVDRDYIPVFSKHTLPKEPFGDDACIPRLRSTIKRITEKFDGNVLLIGHGASIAAVHEILAGDFTYVGQATISKFTETALGEFKLEISGDSSHLTNRNNLRPW